MKYSEEDIMMIMLDALLDSVKRPNLTLSVESVKNDARRISKRQDYYIIPEDFIEEDVPKRRR